MRKILGKAAIDGERAYITGNGNDFFVVARQRDGKRYFWRKTLGDIGRELKRRGITYRIY